MIKVNFKSIGKKGNERTSILIYKNKNIKNDFLEKLRSIKEHIETKRTIEIIYNGNVEKAIDFYKNI